ncbi:MAG: DNA adenine methylase [Gammaproteobacteria bacterium]|nr:DNA adenine methylase [Gammaproteobacteria bacterium]
MTTPISQLDFGLPELDEQPNESGPVLQQAKVFRPIHYLGSKLRLVTVIRDCVNSLDPSRGPVCDLFAGSGTVSLALSQEREVLAVDIQEYSRVLCSALLKPASFSTEIVAQVLNEIRVSEHRKQLQWAVEPLVSHELSCIKQALSGNPEPLCDLLEHGCILADERDLCKATDQDLQGAINETRRRLEARSLVKGSRALVVRHFGGAYFSYAQSADIDAILEVVHTKPFSQRDSLLAAVLSTASDVVNTVGKQFAQPIRPRTKHGEPKRHLVSKIERDRSRDVLNNYSAWLARYQSLAKSERNHQAIQGDYLEVLGSYKGKLSVVYADPPYTRDHYSRFYHVLETLCLRDNPAVSTMEIKGTKQLSRGIYRQDRHQSPFCIRS